MFNPITIHLFKGFRLNLFTLVCTLIFLSALNIDIVKANAQDLTLSNPSSVQLTRSSARINIEEQATVNTENNQASISFAIPYQASDLTISINNSSIPEWSLKDGELNALSSKLGLQYASLIAEKQKIEGQIQAVAASINLWVTPPNSDVSLEDLKKRQNEVEKVVPGLETRYAQIKQNLDNIQEKLNEFPKITRRIKIINAIVPANLIAAKTINIKYSYTLNNCGWLPQYQFNALPDKNTVEVNLFAKIWQYSGLDWKNAQISLLPLSSQNIKPAPLYPWYVKEDSGKLYARRMSTQPMMKNITYNSDEVSFAPNIPTIQENAAFTSYNLHKRNVDEGKVEIRLNQDLWDAKMIWLARPSVGSEVWLTVEHKLADVGAWPAGNAAFLIEDVLIGNSSFSPIANEVTLYFGVDPRLNVKNNASMLLSGKEGFIDKVKTWDWAWDYIIYNGRKSAVQVRLEEAQPQLGNKDLKVKYTSKPKAQIGEDNTLFWDITIPAESSFTIDHAITISAPNDLDINTGR